MPRIVLRFHANLAFSSPKFLLLEFGGGREGVTSLPQSLSLPPSTHIFPALAGLHFDLGLVDKHGLIVTKRHVFPKVSKGAQETEPLDLPSVSVAYQAESPNPASANGLNQTGD